MHSMTGYGKADYENRKLGISIEVSSVNSRFLEYSLRIPRQLSFLEPKFKELIAAGIGRGKIFLTVNYEDNGIGIDRLAINKKLADEIFQQLASLKKTYRLAGEIEIGHLLDFPDIFRIEKADNIKREVWPSMKVAMNRALDELITMRKREGTNLKKDLAARLKHLADRIKQVEKLSSRNVGASRKRLTQRINEVLNGKTLDNMRLEEEVAYIAERSDITEECVRFKSHLKQFELGIKKSGPIGKKLNFILQELNRETNTIGAKAADMKISHFVVELKDEIEKMREQIQNVE